MATLDGTRTLPWAWYADPAVLQLERERIFRTSWQYVGHAGDVPEPGSFAATRVGDVPVVVVRDYEGELRAFLNVCRHRGSIVCSGSGRRATLQCPYHAWTYGLDGTLRSAPRADETAPHEELGLVPLALETWGPFVFVNPDAAAAPLAETLGDLLDELPLDGLSFHHRVEYELASNWKIACENFLECYHCPVAHPGFSAVIDTSPEVYRLEAGETFFSQYTTARSGSHDGYNPHGEVEYGQFHLVWPNFVVNVAPGRPNFSIGPIVPVAPERTVRFLDYLFGEDVDEEWIQGLVAFDDQVGREDADLVASVQRGLGSGMVERGRLLLNSEHLIHGFQRRIADALA